MAESTKAFLHETRNKRPVLSGGSGELVDRDRRTGMYPHSALWRGAERDRDLARTALDLEIATSASETVLNPVSMMSPNPAQCFPSGLPGVAGHNLKAVVPIFW